MSRNYTSHCLNLKMGPFVRGGDSELGGKPSWVYRVIFRDVLPRQFAPWKSRNIIIMQSFPFCSNTFEWEIEEMSLYSTLYSWVIATLPERRKASKSPEPLFVGVPLFNLLLHTPNIQADTHQMWEKRTIRYKQTYLWVPLVLLHPNVTSLQDMLSVSGFQHLARELQWLRWYRVTCAAGGGFGGRGNGTTDRSTIGGWRSYRWFLVTGWIAVEIYEWITYSRKLKWNYCLERVFVF